MEKVLANARQKLNRPEDDQIVLHQKVNEHILGFCMSTTVKAAVHLEQDYQENLRTIKKTDFEKIKTLLKISQKSILNQKDETFEISTIEWNFTPWMRTTLLHDGAIKLSKAEVHVYSDSVLCLGKNHEHPHSIEHKPRNIEWFMRSREYRELNGIDGEPVEFERNIFPKHTTLQ